jgi:spore coat protein U-like protein
MAGNLAVAPRLLQTRLMVLSSQRMPISRYETSTMSERAADVRDRRHRARGALAASARLALVACAALAPKLAAAAPECSFDAVPNIVFTGYSPFAATGAAASTQITYKCPGSINSVAIGISTPRVLTSAAGDTLQFDLYRSPYPGPLWTDQPPVPLTPTPKDGMVTVYAHLPPQSAAVGAYQATLDVTIYTEGVAGQTRTMIVQVTVGHTCTIAAGTLSFGPYDPIGANATNPRDAQGTIQISCTAGTPWSVTLGPGSFPSGAVRQMANGTARLQYELYSDAGRVTPWNMTSTVAATAPSTAPVNLVVHGRIPAGQSVPAGTYADTVMSTINF